MEYPKLLMCWSRLTKLKCIFSGEGDLVPGQQAGDIIIRTQLGAPDPSEKDYFIHEGCLARHFPISLYQLYQGISQTVDHFGEELFICHHLDFIGGPLQRAGLSRFRVAQQGFLQDGNGDDSSGTTRDDLWIYPELYLPSLDKSQSMLLLLLRQSCSDDH